MKQSGEIVTPYGLAMTVQYGRSMVEMLGVLAVIGILSVAGIAGFKNAMNKHKANTLIDEASKRAVVIAAQILSGINISIGEFPNNDELGFSDTVGYNKFARQFSLTIEGVSESVCKQMKNAQGDIIRKFLPTDCSDNTDVILTYNADLSATDLEVKQNEDGTCKGGYTGDNCQNKIDCGVNGEWTSDGCVCSSGWYGKQCDSDCDGFKDISGICRDCSYDSYDYAQADECHRCSERFVASSSSGPVCQPCSNPSWQFAAPDEDEYYSRCLVAGFDLFKPGTKTYLYSCTDNVQKVTWSSECDKCVLHPREEVIFDGKSYCQKTCEAGKEFRVIQSNNSNHLLCVSCDSSGTGKTTADECEKCGDKRTMQNGYCIPQTCGTNEVRDYVGGCQLCDGTINFNATNEQCSICAEKGYLRFACTVNRADGCCSCSSTSGVKPKNMNDIQICAEKGYPRFTWNGYTYLCAYDYKLTADSSSIQICTQYGIPRFMGNDGKSYPCSSYDSVIPEDVSSLQACAEIGKPRFIDSRGYSHYCLQGPWESVDDESACLVCGELRYYEDGKCLKK